MNLEEFIHKTLTSIYKGVEKTNKKLIKAEGQQGPFSLSSTGDSAFIEFDVAVTVETAESKRGKAGLKVYVAEAGGEGEQTDAEQTVSHIKFKIQAREDLV